MNDVTLAAIALSIQGVINSLLATTVEKHHTWTFLHGRIKNLSLSELVKGWCVNRHHRPCSSPHNLEFGCPLSGQTSRYDVKKDHLAPLRLDLL